MTNSLGMFETSLAVVTLVIKVDVDTILPIFI